MTFFDDRELIFILDEDNSISMHIVITYLELLKYSHRRNKKVIVQTTVENIISVTKKSLLKWNKEMVSLTIYTAV